VGTVVVAQVEGSAVATDDAGEDEADGVTSTGRNAVVVGTPSPRRREKVLETSELTVSDGNCDEAKASVAYSSTKLSVASKARMSSSPPTSSISSRFECSAGNLTVSGNEVVCGLSVA